MFHNSSALDAKSRTVGRIAFIVPAFFILIGLELERSWLYLPYFVTEWMTNYTAGFIRRGMLGEAFWLLGAGLHTSPMLFIEVARFLIAGAFSVAAGSLVYKNRESLGWVGAVAVLASPCVTFFLWCETGSLDLLFVLITFVHLGLTHLDQDRYVRQTTLLFALGGVFLALTHEALFLFLCLPVNALILSRKCPGHPFAKGLTVFGLPVVAALVAILFHGTQAQGHAIYDHWIAIGFNQPFALGFEQIGLTLPEELRRVWADFSIGRLGIWLLNVLVCAGPLFWLASKMCGSGADALKSLRNYFLIPLLAATPLFILGTDWDRWFSLVCIVAMVCFLSEKSVRAPIHFNWKSVSFIAVFVLAGLFVRPYAPFLPIHRFVAGPIVRTTEFFMGVVPR